MIAGLDSSFDRPNASTTAAAYAAGIRVWGGYIGTRGGLGLATLWSQADFDVVRNAGMTAIGFCSGWDDPAAVRDLAASWGVLLCVDVERGIRDDGPWVQAWLDASGAGLYGSSSVHYNTGGRRAAFHIVSWYGYTPPACYDPGATWPPWLPRLAAPVGWQFCGTHNEFGLSVDRGWYDDWFGGDPMTAEQAAQLAWLFTQWNPGPDGAGGKTLRDYFGDIYNKLASVVAGTVAVDVNALAAALIPHLPAGTDPAVVAKAVADELEKRLQA